jgi:hypothetical protein
MKTADDIYLIAPPHSFLRYQGKYYKWTYTIGWNIMPAPKSVMGWSTLHEEQLAIFRPALIEAGLIKD